MELFGNESGGLSADEMGLSADFGTAPQPIAIILNDATIRRIADILISMLALIFATPLMIVVAVIIVADSSGPVFYRQQRVGLNGVPFTMLKFRSMRADAETSGPQWAAVVDPRVTRVGRWLRLTRIDELPQFFNVLVGTMSAIGPRPERPHFVAQLTSVIPHYQARTSVKPGVTGWAQVNYPYGASIEDAREKLRFDLYYVKHRSFLLDLKILLATIPVVLAQIGAR